MKNVNADLLVKTFCDRLEIAQDMRERSFKAMQVVATNDHGTKLISIIEVGKWDARIVAYKEIIKIIQDLSE